ncbi:MAG: small conductance mechanosensitive channel, partial [Hyphomonas sp.]
MMPEFDMTGWPAWAQAAEPQVLKWSLVLAATIAIWIVAVLVKR